MSYVVRIWSPPAGTLPESIDVAAGMVAAQDKGGKTTDNPAFVTLAQRLIQNFPTADLVPEEDGDPVAWADWSSTDRLDEAVWNLGLNVDMLETVHPVLVKEANALGLCVTDDQAGAVFLPGGKILGSAGFKPAAPHEPAKLSLDDLLPATIAPTLPYRLHILCATMVSVADAERELNWARQGASCSEFRLRCYETFVRMLNHDQRDAQPLPWFDGQPLDARFEGKMMTVEVRADCIAAIRPRVLLAAAWQGLSVYDPQAQQAFWPSGSFVVGDELYEVWRKGRAVYPEYPPFRAAKVMAEALPALLGPLGFTLADDCDDGLQYERRLTGIRQGLSVFCGDLYPGTRIEIRVDIEMTPEVPRGESIPWPQREDGTPLRLNIRTNFTRFFAPGETYAWFLDYDPDRNAAYQTWFKVYADNHVRSAAQAITQKLIERVLPVLRQGETVGGLNEVVNAKLPVAGQKSDGPFVDDHWSPYNLMLAHLADDLRFDAMCADAQARYGASWERGGRLEQHVLPPSQFAAIKVAREQARNR
jgi:hypothetical protein